MTAAPQLRLWCRPSITRQPFRRWQSTSSLLHNLSPRPPSQKSTASSPPIRRVPGDPPPIRTNPTEPRLNPNPRLQGRTFQLLEFYNPFGADAHHFLFIQRYRNGFALTTLEDNLRHAFATGEVASYLYTYTNIELEDLEKSCLHILNDFGISKEAARYNVVIGKIGVEPRGAEEGEAEWFEKTFGSVRDPDWGRLRGIVIDFGKDQSVPDEDRADSRSLA